jgi:hypothetical protein
MTLRGASVAVRMSAWIAFLGLFGRVLPLRASLRLLDTKTRGPKRVSAERLAAIADGILHHADARHRSCWKRAAVLRRYLLLNGIETAVVFGVRKGDDKLAGHAWLERDGEPFLEAARPDYVVTFRYPS